MVYVEKDRPAPFSGYLMNQERVERVRNISLELSSQQKINDLLKQENSMLLEKYNAYKQPPKEQSMVEKVGYFLLGVGVTTIAVFGVKKATQ